MECWEYQVIHLNVEPPAPAPPSVPPAAAKGAEPPPGAAPIRVEGVFSKEYLEKEFPGFYGSAPAREHPAKQLRGFLNLQGRDGWQLVGIYPVGQLSMMIFRRPLAAPEGPDAMDSADPAMASAPKPMADSGTPAPPVQDVDAGDVADGQPDRQSAALERILERLEALERRLPAPSEAAAPAPAHPEETVEPVGLAALRDGEILAPQCWDELEGLPRLSSPEAARALGFRSAASLLNLAARSGYPPGLVKRGLHGALAVYVGSEKSGRGGRDRRLWVMFAPSDGASEAGS